MVITTVFSGTVCFSNVMVLRDVYDLRQAVRSQRDPQRERGCFLRCPHRFKIAFCKKPRASTPVFSRHGRTSPSVERQTDPYVANLFGKYGSLGSNTLTTRPITVPSELLVATAVHLVDKTLLVTRGGPCSCLTGVSTPRHVLLTA